MFLAAVLIFFIILPFPVAGTVDRLNTDQCGIHANGSTHHPVVQQLVDIVNSDPVFRSEMIAALLEQEPTSYWYGKTLDDMYTFCDEWVVFLPTIDTARLYMDRFYEFADYGLGQQLATRDPLRGWLYQFMLAVQEFKDSEASAAIVPSWTSDSRINMADYIVPPGGFQSFNQFFTRELNPGVRPIDAPDDPSIMTSPADSSLMNIADSLTSVTTIGIKGDNLNIHELLGNDPLANNFINGKAVLCMLNTTDYHNFHAPVPGRIVSTGQMAGLYYGMDGGWVEYFFQHRRGYLIFDTEKFGHVAMACVGMFTISSINFTAAQGDIVEKGDKLGNFAYGGSAVILLFEPGRVSFTVPLAGPPRHISMGNALAVAVQPVQTATATTALGEVAFTTSAGSIQGLTTIGASQISCASPDYYFPYGQFSCNLINLRPGQAVRLTIKFPNPLPLGTRYFKCNNNVLTDCSAFSNRINEYILTLDIVDGGQGDNDGAANGTIVDPGGPGFPFNGTSGTSSGSSATMPSVAQRAPVSLSNIVVKSASLSAVTATPGTPVIVTAGIANTGTGNGTSVIRVYVNGSEEAQQGITVNSGSTATITFDVSRNEPGTYTVYVGGTQAGSFTVKQFTPDTILFISCALVFFSLILGIIYLGLRRRTQG